jgi:hypothetical protein
MVLIRNLSGHRYLILGGHLRHIFNRFQRSPYSIKDLFLTAIYRRYWKLHVDLTGFVLVDIPAWAVAVVGEEGLDALFDGGVGGGVLEFVAFLGNGQVLPDGHVAGGGAAQGRCRSSC